MFCCRRRNKVKSNDSDTEPPTTEDVVRQVQDVILQQMEENFYTVNSRLEKIKEQQNIQESTLNNVQRHASRGAMMAKGALFMAIPYWGKLTSGEHNGKTVMEVLETARGLEWLQWMSTHAGTLRNAAMVKVGEYVRPKTQLP